MQLHLEETDARSISPDNLILLYNSGMTKYLGIDYGKRYLGLALSDDDGVLAFPHSIVLNDEHLFPYLSELIKKESISGIVLGESYDLDGNPNILMDDILIFKTELEKTVRIPAIFQKEFLSSFEASRFQHNRVRADDSAAAIILQRYLDKNNQRKSTQ